MVGIAQGSRRRIFVNSLPKSGTNLLASILGQMEGLTFQRLPLTRNMRLHPINFLFFFDPRTCLAGVDQPCKVKVATLRYLLRSLPQGSFTIGHLLHQEVVVKVLAEYGIDTFFVSRDPRDVVVSKMYYNLSLQRHFLHQDYVAAATDKERIKLAILGVRHPDGSLKSLGIAEKVRLVLPWLATPNVMSLRFEDMIGPKGGGSVEVQERVIQDIGRHIGRDLDGARARQIGESMFGTGASFRKGAIGAWREHFDDELKTLFKERAGRELIALGYERDLDW